MRKFIKPGEDDLDSDDSIDFVDDEEIQIMFEVIADNEMSTENPENETSANEASESSYVPSEDEAQPGPSSSNLIETRSRAAGPSSRESAEEDVDDEDEEEDETIKALIAAVKKPRTQPPEIKLDDFVTDICFHPEQDILAIGLITGDVVLYKYANEENTLVKSFEVHTKSCRDVEFNPDGSVLITGSRDLSIMLTDVETGKLKNFYDNAHKYAIYKMYVIDENLFTSGDDCGTVKLWDARLKEPVFALKEVEDCITSMLTNDAQKLLLFTSGDGYLTTVNIGARKLYVQSEPYEEELTCMGLFRNDSKVVVGTSKGRLYTYNWGEFGYHCDMFPGMKNPINVMLPITDRIGCVAGDPGIIRAGHIAPFRNLGIVGQHTYPVEAMDINHSGEFIASCSHNHDVRFWNIKYFEDFDDIKYNEKHDRLRERQHNLPSSKYTNASDFFADLA